MGPSCWQSNSTSSFATKLLAAAVIFGLLAATPALIAQTNSASQGAAATEPQGRSADDNAAAKGQSGYAAASGTISGTVLDVTGAPVAGAEVRLTRETATPVQVTTTEPDGRFFYSNVAPGLFDLSISFAGFKTKSVSGTMAAAEGSALPAITLDVASIVTDVSVRLTTEEIATEQIKAQEQQRLLAVVPNFYTSYVRD